jgi:soluble lytic murein transglycosylase-like protein
MKAQLTIVTAAIYLWILGGTATAQGPRFYQSRATLEGWARYYAITYRMPVELVRAIIEEESRWNPYAVSNKGAAGVMQLMPKTAARFGVQDRFRGDENIRGGVAYLAWLAWKFQGDLRLVTAAYYVGEVAISSRGLEFASRDVHDYVERVARRYRRARAKTPRQRLIEEVNNGQN